MKIASSIHRLIIDLLTNIKVTDIEGGMEGHGWGGWYSICNVHVHVQDIQWNLFKVRYYVKACQLEW